MYHVSMYITRFAPSPTGGLHLGGLRTALFNYLYARHFSGKFYLRIEDTDYARSKKEFEKNILETLKICKLEYDAIFWQSTFINNHIKIANQLLATGYAYKCFCSSLPKNEEHKCREGNLELQSPFVLRFKMPQSTELSFLDLVQKTIKVNSSNLYDFVLLRSDNTPTYLLSCAADDIHMKITHVIRGDDHIINTFYQIQIFKALGYTQLQYAHIPLIHDNDGKKLSKRDQVIDVMDLYRDGILPEALCNYLLRLGWSHGDDEIISRRQAIEWFDVTNINLAAARFDIKKLLSVNTVYIRNHSTNILLQYLRRLYNSELRQCTFYSDNYIFPFISLFHERVKTLSELKNYLISMCLNLLPDYNTSYKPNINAQMRFIQTLWFDTNNYEDIIRKLLIEHSLQLKDVAHILRWIFTGQKVSPGLFEFLNCFPKFVLNARILYYLCNYVHV